MVAGAAWSGAPTRELRRNTRAQLVSCLFSQAPSETPTEGGDLWLAT